MPSVQRKDIDNTSAIITVTLSKDDLKPKIDAELKRYRNKASIKGFRQGQTPIAVIKRMFGSSIFADAFNDMLAQQLTDYLRESKLNVLGQPLPAENQKQYSFKIDDLENEYAVNYEIGFVPDVEVKGLNKDHTFERLTVSDLDKLAEQDLDYARKRMGNRSNPENDIQENDILKIASHELDGNAPKADGWETTISTLVNTIKDEGLKKTLLASKKGDTIQFNARLLDFGDDDAKFRKYVLNLPDDDTREVGDMFEGTIEEVSRVEEAELNEAFFKEYFGDGVSTKEEAMEQIKKGVLGFYDVRSNALLMREFQQYMMEQNQFELPDTFLKRWLVLNNEELTPEKVEAEYPAFADNLRWSLLKDELRKKYSIEVSQEELRAAYAQKVRNYFQGAAIPENIIESSVERLMQDEKDVENTIRDLETDKIFEALRTEFTIKDKAIPSEEFHQTLDEITKKAEQEQAANTEIVE
ncbi:MAG: hypothetical protein EP344_12145 [Bacteroidetes bacterium]|nr:MAG: hypothetical protein EP344_12145 [Bacteroidota bacterium]